MTTNPKSMDPIEGFMCITDFESELGAAADGVKVYPSVAALKQYKPCAEECGIMKVTVTGVEVVQPGIPQESIDGTPLTDLIGEIDEINGC